MSAFVVEDFDAVGDGVADDTGALQAAVDAAFERGGGRVVLAAGRSYRCGSVELRSRVELHLEPGSRLVAARSITDFSRRFVVGALASGLSTRSHEATAAMLWADGAEDVSITGSGVIDGSADAYVTEAREEIHRMTNERPFPVFLIGCTRVTVRDVRFVDAALWTLRLSGCRNVHIAGVRIDNDMRVPNADGIDLDHCSRVQVVGCDIRCPDDGISLKTTDEFVEFGPCEDVVVTGCTIESLSNAVTLGVDADSPIRNVVVTGCVVRNSHRGVSVSVGTGVGGYVENVLFSDLVIETRHADDDWWGCGEPIVVRSAPWHDLAGAVFNIRFRNILARSENGILIYAGGNGVVRDVELSDVRLELSRWTSYPGHRLDLRPYDAAPVRGEYRTGLLSTQPAAVHVEGADEVRLRDVRVHWDDLPADEFGPTLRIERATRVQWRDFTTTRDGKDALSVDGELSALPPGGAV